ncbi:MAG: hypothetical protein NC344_10190 [Bacteroidales bacterium]|nr:hypothetical protein [Bacteroidales bacterium]MCM1148173.1 hypothetical protein [Bacteroidales bacterium]MCM1207100.1 hypothetical protein [Bacillota bacterium]MCM1510852.1 hypothetical protein [Clostridium sp.]
MEEEKKVVMAWAQCKIEIGKMGAGDTMAETLTEVGRVKDKTTALTSDLGTALESYASGHKLIAREYPEEQLTVNTTVVEPSDELLELLGISDESGKVRSHYIEGYFSIVITPKHKGAKGIKAPKCQITYSPAFGEETGNECTLAFSITKTSELGDEENYWYERFRTTTELA